jgi:hypothetical protein
MPAAPTGAVQTRWSTCSPGVVGDPNLPEQHGQRPAINVTVPISTLLGRDNQPAHLDGYGPITAALARRLAADPTGTWRRLVTDDTAPTGHRPT